MTRSHGANEATWNLLTLSILASPLFPIITCSKIQILQFRPTVLDSPLYITQFASQTPPMIMVMADSNQDMSTISYSGISPTITVHITIAVILLNFIIFIAILIFYIRSKGYFRGIGSSRSHRLVFAEHEPAIPRRALPQSILNSLPVTVFRIDNYKENGGLECAVCLCGLSDGEKARFLPKCKHGFHVECIDMWFHSNSTCPLCRNPVREDDRIESLVEIPLQDLEVDSEAGHSSATGTSTSLVIDIPRRMMNGFSLPNSPVPLSRMTPHSPLPTSRMSAEMIKSPVLGRMRSLRRILSRGSSGKGEVVN